MGYLWHNTLWGGVLCVLTPTNPNKLIFCALLFPHCTFLPTACNVWMCLLILFIILWTHPAYSKILAMISSYRCDTMYNKHLGWIPQSDCKLQRYYLEFIVDSYLDVRSSKVKKGGFEFDYLKTNKFGSVRCSKIWCSSLFDK